MTLSDYVGSIVPGLQAALASRPAPATTELESLPWFPFPVLTSPRCRSTAVRLARRTERAYWFLRQTLDVAPATRLLVLDRAAWPHYAEAPDYGVVHVTRAGDLVAGAEPALAWTEISAWLADHLDKSTLGKLVRVHGEDAHTPGPALGDMSELLIAHELAHLVADQAGVRFPRRWLGEAFANYAMVAVLGETDPLGLRRLGSLAQATETLAGLTPTLAEFEKDFGHMNVMPSVLAQLALTRGVYDTYAAAQSAPLARLFRLFREPAADVTGGQRVRVRPGLAPDADFEVGRMLVLHALPTLAAIPAFLPGEPHRAAA